MIFIGTLSPTVGGTSDDLICKILQQSVGNPCCGEGWRAGRRLPGGRGAGLGGDFCRATSSLGAAVEEPNDSCFGPLG